MRLGLDNVRVIEGDARAYIERFVHSDSVDAYHVLFPDPWWKKRHHKRRLFRPDFVAELHRTLAAGGMLVVKTDVEAYADLIDEELHAHAGFSLAGTAGDDPELAALPLSHREKKCAEFAIPVFQFRFSKVEATP
jgi:tRNA (guanine-N7-)-methyltransferase